MTKLIGLCFLIGAWACAFGFVRFGLFAFVVGGIPSVVKRDILAAGFMLANFVGLWRIGI